MNKTAIITGAGGALGQEVAKKFLGEGFNVEAIVHKSHVGEEKPFGYNENVCNLISENETQQTLKNIFARSQEINVAVLTAGGFVAGDILETNSKQVLEQINLNFLTAFNIAVPIFKKMLEQNNGRIFLIGSKPGLNVAKGTNSFAYALSKSLLFRLAEGLNAKAKNKNVVTNIIIPSVIDTLQNRKEMPNENFSEWVKPSVIADIILSYSSEQFDDVREPLIKIYNNS